MSVEVKKFVKKKENNSSTVITNTNKGYSNTVTTVGSLDRMLWNIHDTGQDINGTLRIPGLSVTGQINANGYIHSDTEVNAPTGRFDRIYNSYDINTYNLNVSNLITTKDLKVTDTAEISYIHSHEITTEFLKVTKSAHFAELIIDKIKSVGGSAIFTPADGFKISDENDIIPLKIVNSGDTPCVLLAWDAKDEDVEIDNMWLPGDQALCENFNRVHEGENLNVSNTFFWAVVLDTGTYNPDDNELIQYNCSRQASTTKKVTAYRRDNNVVVSFDTKKHYIILADTGYNYTDITGRGYEARTGYIIGDDNYPGVHVGDNIVMMGHRPQRGEAVYNSTTRQWEYTDYSRMSAIYIAAYNGAIETLNAPFISQYTGINDFDLPVHRKTWFSVGGNNSIGGVDNHITGNFEILNIDDYISTNAATYFILTDRSYISVNNSNTLTNALTITADAYYLSGNSAPARIGTKGDENLILSLYINDTVYERQQCRTDDCDFTIPANINVNNFYFSIERITVNPTNNQTVYTEIFRYNIPVLALVDGIDGIDGKDGEFYKIEPIEEIAQINVRGNFDLSLKYHIQHIKGPDTEIVTNNNIYNIRFITDFDREHSGTMTTLSFNDNTDIYSFKGNISVDGDTNRYYKTNVFGTGTQHGLSNDKFIYVECYDNNGDILDTRVIPVILQAGAMFSVTDSITGRVQTSEQKITTLEGDTEEINSYIAQLQIKADSISSVVSRTSGVYGNNMLLNSSFQKIEDNDQPEYWTIWNAEGYEHVDISLNEDYNFSYINLKSTVNQNNVLQNGHRWTGIMQNTDMRNNNEFSDILPDHLYYVSFYAKKNSVSGMAGGIIHFLNSAGSLISSNSTIHNQNEFYTDITTEWKRYGWVFRTPDSNDVYGFQFHLGLPENVNYVIDIDFTLPMINDIGEVTDEKKELYGLTDTHIQMLTNVNNIPAWCGNGHDVTVSSSQISQTADLIRAQVGDCGVDITEKKIVLNGNTEINGSLNIYDEDTGFVLNGLGGITQISPKSVGNYYTDFRQNIETVFNRTEIIIGTSASKSTRTAYYNYNIRIYLGKISARKRINFNSMSYRFYNSNNDHIQPFIGERPVMIQIEEKYNSSTVTTSKEFGNFYYTVGSNDADIYLVFNKTVGHNINELGSVNNTPYCDLTIQYTIPNDAFTLIGYDGIGMNFGTGVNVFFGKNEAVLRYGQYGLRITNGNISKIIGLDDNNQEIWGNLNTPKIKVTGNDITSWPAEIDMIVTTKANSNIDQVIYLPADPYIGRTVYIRKRSISKVNIYSSDTTMMKGYSQTSSSHMVSPGTPIQIGDNGLEFKFTFDGNYWLVNYLDGI